MRSELAFGHYGGTSNAEGHLLARFAREDKEFEAQKKSESLTKVV